jgi:hypothetical protein
VPEFERASTAVDRKSMGHTMADRSSNEADFLCIIAVFSVAVMEKCCDACGFTVITVSGRFFQRPEAARV